MSAASLSGVPPAASSLMNVAALSSVPPLEPSLHVQSPPASTPSAMGPSKRPRQQSSRTSDTQSATKRRKGTNPCLDDFQQLYDSVALDKFCDWRQVCNKMAKKRDPRASAEKIRETAQRFRGKFKYWTREIARLKEEFHNASSRSEPIESFILTNWKLSTRPCESHVRFLLANPG